MAGPPGWHYSLEGRHQFRNRSCRQERGFKGRFGGEIGAADGNVRILTGNEFDLAMADVSWQVGEARQLQDPAVQGMTGIGNRDLALARLCDQRCITLAGVCRFRSDPSGRRSHGAE